MNRNITVNVILLIVLVGFTMAENRTDGCKKVDQLLGESSKDNDVRANLKLIKEEYNKLESNSNKRNFNIFRRKKKLAEIENFKLVLNELANMSEVFEHPKCDKSDYDIMHKQQILNEADQYVENPKIELTSVGYLIYQIALERALACRENYLRKFYEWHSQMDSKLRALEEFKSSSFDRRPDMNQREYFEWLVDNKYVLKSKDYQEAAEFVKSQVGNSKEVEEKDVRTFLLNPCIDFKNQIGKNILEEAIRDGQLFKDHVAYDSLEDDLLIEFYRSIALYRYCLSIVSDEDFAGKTGDYLIE